MYFVDREKIEEILLYMEKQMDLFQSSDGWNTPVEQLAVERIAHTLIESILDTGNAMIDGFIMRDPGSYEDIIDILLDEKVITAEMEHSLKNVIGFRKMVVQEYTQVDHEAVEKILTDNMESLRLFPGHIREYLTNELGPVSAFRN
ncbi:type VII toxin-antitoxin system HepT family RNase toxin [Bacillus sp. SCS-153A]|uniref:type VII toxin-antitoxin system HepT family RNase toxin n=1 Tax=Rossellomorea sedimentorum TaxID=3115294 RepID=UPI003906BAAA